VVWTALGGVIRRLSANCGVSRLIARTIVVQKQAGELTSREVTAFVEQGFVRIDGAFPEELAAEARAILWRDTGCDPDDPSTWTKPVVRLGFYSHPPFVAAANTATLHRALPLSVPPVSRPRRAAAIILISLAIF
jgi:hypothetical protein